MRRAGGGWWLQLLEDSDVTSAVTHSLPPSFQSHVTSTQRPRIPPLKGLALATTQRLSNTDTGGYSFTSCFMVPTRRLDCYLYAHHLRVISVPPASNH